MKKTLVLFAHPFLEFSKSHRELLKIYDPTKGFHLKDLYEQFPDMHVPAFRERKRIVNYDRFVFHFPLIWFGVPSLLRLWMDEVSDADWLNGKAENPFDNKDVYILVTSRNKETSFSKTGKYGYTIEEMISGLLVNLKVFNAKVKLIYPVFEVEKQSLQQIEQHQLNFLRELGLD